MRVVNLDVGASKSDICAIRVATISERAGRTRTCNPGLVQRQLWKTLSLPERHAGGLKSCSDEVRDLGLCRSSELADDILGDPVGVRYALVLPEVLEPGHARAHKGAERR